MLNALIRKKKAPTTALKSAVALHRPDGQPLIVFSGDVVDACRRMVTGLLWREAFPSRVSVVSALRGEGVTYVSLALAAIMAHDMPAKIGLVELNWWSPGMQKLLSSQHQHTVSEKEKRRKKTDASPNMEPTNLSVSPGLAGILTRKSSIEEALVSTNLPNLSLLPAGDLPIAQRPIFARSNELKDLIDRLSQEYDHLFLDVPAILESSDAIAAASLSEAAVVVVQQGVTTTNSLQLALDEIRHMSMLGVVMNKNRIHTPKWLYNLIPQE